MGNTLNITTDYKTIDASDSELLELFFYEAYVVSNMDSIMIDEGLISSSHALAYTILYTIICILSIVGNLITCVVITTNTNLQNATNCYLFSLSVSDVMLVISGSFIEVFNAQRPHHWQKAPCVISYFLYRASYNTSVLTVLAFSIERYLAICHPFSFKAISGIKRSIGIILAIWIICFISAYPEFYRDFYNFKLRFLINSVLPLESKYEIGFCMVEVSENIQDKYVLSMAVIFFLILMTIIFIVYIRIAIRIQNSLKNVNLAQQVRSQNRHRSIKMLFVVMNFICWTPIQACNVTEIYFGFFSRNTKSLQGILLYFVIFKALFVCSAFINPIIYNIMSSRFREGFLKTFLIICGKVKGNKETVQLVSIIPKPE